MDLIEELKKLPRKRIRTFDSRFHEIIDFDKLDTPITIPELIGEPIGAAVGAAINEVLDPEPEPEPEKIICPICNKLFMPQGYPKHLESCQKKAELLKKKEALEKELSGIGE